MSNHSSQNFQNSSAHRSQLATRYSLCCIGTREAQLEQPLVALGTAFGPGTRLGASERPHCGYL